MPRCAVKIEYDGSCFHGWQLQPGVRTVQGVLEDAAARASGSNSRITIHGAGRTDSGVHAKAQVAHFDTAAAREPEISLRAINYWLPGDVSVTEAANAAPEFHARFSALSKIYRYSVLVSESRRPLSERYNLRLRRRPDLRVLNACADMARGRHDFAAFTSSGSDTEDTVRNIIKSAWKENGELLHYEVEGDGFTYNMVRALVGSMLEAAAGTASAEDFAAALEGDKRSMAGPTAPAKGLMLMAVNYPSELDPFLTMRRIKQ